ncbi:hypothetical protein HDV06_006490 [Boothiomyces sp. JEL0866]|nr:hypothetical protein HDV06_006490 [Boothiomyces sp. JEL0866]
MNLFLLITSIFCLYEKDAGVLDWHQKHIGTPVSINHFHQSTIVSTDKNIIASLNQNEIIQRIELNSNIIKTVTNVLVYTLTDSKFYIHDQDLFLINEIPVLASDFIVEGDSVYLFSSNSVSKIKEGAVQYNILLDFTCLGIQFRDGLYVYGKNKELVVGKVLNGKLQKTEFPDTLVQDLVSIHGQNSDYLIWKEKDIRVVKLGSTSVTALSTILPGYDLYHPVQIQRGSRFALEKGTKSVIVSIDDDFKAHVIQKHSSNLKKYTWSKYGKEEIISIIHQQGNQIIVENDQEHKFEIDSSKYGPIEKVWTQYKHTREGYSPRLFATTKDGSLHYFEKNFKWTLEESLAYSVDALMVDLPVDNHAKEIELPTNKTILENYFVRLTRHLTMKSIETIGDLNGFQKVAVFITEKHKIYGIDTTTGDILWHEYVDFKPQNLYLARDYRVASPPVVSVIGKKEKETIYIQINALTGSLYGNLKHASLKIGDKVKKAFPTGLTEKETSITVFAFFLENNQLLITPNTKATRAEFAKTAGSTYFYVQEENRLAGYVVGEELDSTFSTVRTWTFALSAGEKIVDIAKADFNEVASLGRVLGDRSVLYKYLNPNLLAILTLSETKTTSTTNLYLLDSVSGILHHKIATLGAGNLVNDMHLLFCENFIVYTYWNHGPSKAKNGTLAVNSKHYEVAVLELYESARANNRVDSPVFSSFHNSSFDFIAQTFISAHPIDSLGVTRTLAGITSREIIFGLKQGMLLGASRKLLDPRRPKHSPTSYDKEEQLYPYHPVIGTNPKDTLSYNLQVLHPTTIISKETLLESTSLVLSYGTDIFLTRRMPSKMFDRLKDDFSYAQLVLSIVALVGGIIAARYYSERKVMREAWN